MLLFYAHIACLVAPGKVLRIILFSETLPALCDERQLCFCPLPASHPGYPLGVAVSTDGSILVADANNDRVVIAKSDGSFLDI